jgi:hypothetical protein
MPSNFPSRRAKIVLVLLAWLSPVISGTALFLFLVRLGEIGQERQVVNQGLKQGDRAAFAKAKREETHQFHVAAAATALACLAGGVLAVVSLFGIKTAGWWLILPGALLGIAAAGIVIAIVGLIYIATGIQV